MKDGIIIHHLEDVDDDGKLRKKYNRKKENAKYVQHIEFKLTFQDFVNLVYEAGIKSSDLGYKGKRYVLGRYRDKGPYAIGNCRFITQEENIAERTEKDYVWVDVGLHGKKDTCTSYTANKKCSVCGKRVRNNNITGMCGKCYKKYRHDNRTEHTKHYYSISIKGQLEEHPERKPFSPELFKKRHKRYKIDVWIYDKPIPREQPTKRPPRDILINDLRNIRNYKKIGEKYGVSDNSVKKWCRKYKLPDKKSKLILLTSWDWDKLLAD